jgi:AcrR family transcriptional regulator
MSSTDAPPTSPESPPAPRDAPPTPSDAAPIRRTQEQRRAETQGKLLDATIQSVLEVGYAATTMRRVAELAGVSQGAQTHHFPHRVDLVGAAVEQLAQRRIQELRELATGFPISAPQRLEAMLDVLWADFSSSTFTVFVKLWVAAADDPELYDRLVTVERQIGRAIGELVREFAGELAQRPNWENRVQLALAAVRGVALTQQFEPRGRAPRELWPQVRAALIQGFST